MKKKTKKNGLKMLMATAVLAAAGAHIVSMLTADRVTEYREVTFSSKKIKQNINGYTIAFVTDTHDAAPEELEAIVSRIEKRGADLLLLGGDYAEARLDMAEQVQILSGAKTADGFYGVDGNHDDYSALSMAMHSAGIRLLENEGVRLHDGLYLCGVEDLLRRCPDVARAAGGAEESDFILMLSHSPDVAMLQDTAKVDLILSGHTHGGQMNLFGRFSPVLYMVSDFGQSFRSGWIRLKENATSVYVSNGVGTHHHAPRVFARPQVIFLTLKSA